MKDIRDTERLLQTHLDGVRTPEGADSDGSVLADALVAMQPATQHAAPADRPSWRTIMARRSSRFAAAAGAAVIVSFAVFHTLSEPAFALEDAIEALKAYHAVHVVGTIPGGTAEVWMRADDSRHARLTS